MKQLILTALLFIISQFVYGQEDIIVPKVIGNVKAVYVNKYKYISEDNSVTYSYFLVGEIRNGLNQVVITPIQLNIGDSLSVIGFIYKLDKFIERTNLIVDKEGQLSYNTPIKGLTISYIKKKDKFHLTWPSIYNNEIVNKSWINTNGVFNIDDYKYNKQDMLELVDLLKKSLIIQF